MDAPQLIGESILDLSHPIRQLYETLFEVLTAQQFAHLITRLAEKAAENQPLGQENETRDGNPGDRVVQLSGGDRMPGTCND